MEPTADPDVFDNREASRYELRIDGEQIGLADYRMSREVTVLPHVEIDPAHGGQGLGHRLVRAVLDDIRADGRRVQPLCPFVRAFISENPDYADLVA